MLFFVLMMLILHFIRFHLSVIKLLLTKIACSTCNFTGTEHLAKELGFGHRKFWKQFGMA